MTTIDVGWAHTEDPSEYRVMLTEQQVAYRQCRSVKTLQNQRVAGGGIPFLKLGRSVRYRLCDVIAWEAARLVGSTSESLARCGDEGAV
jgi:hypothetical protein